MAFITSGLKWLKALLESLGVNHPYAINLFCDSQLTLHIPWNPVFNEHTKHIEVDYHYVCDVVRDGIIATYNVSTNEQLVDIFTKALEKQQFIYLFHKLRICDPHAGAY